MNRVFPIFVLVASAVVLGAALLSQYWGGLLPCELCLKERWPWTAAIVVGFVVVTTGGGPVTARVALLLAAIFVIGSGLAFYHVGVEQHWFPGPTSCTAAGTAPATIDELRTQLLHQQPVRCDEPAWTLFGVSMAGWNLLASLVMAGVSLAVLRRVRPHRRGRIRGEAL